MDTFNKRCTQGAIAFVGFSAFALARALVLSRAEPNPRGKVVLATKTAHVSVCFGNDHLGHASIDARSAFNPMNVVILLAQECSDMDIQLRDLGGENSDIG